MNVALSEKDRKFREFALEGSMWKVIWKVCYPLAIYQSLNQLFKILDTMMAATYRRWEQDTFDAYCRRFALPEKTAFKDYSRGMKMKLTIAVALSHQAQLLVLDEATAGLDPIVRDEILELFNEFTRDETHSVLISSHILSDLEKLCDYIAFLHQGRLLFCEEKDALLEQYGTFNDTAEQAHPYNLQTNQRFPTSD